MISGGAATVLGGNRMLKTSQNYAMILFIISVQIKLHMIKKLPITGWYISNLLLNRVNRRCLWPELFYPHLILMETAMLFRTHWLI